MIIELHANKRDVIMDFFILSQSSNLVVVCSRYADHEVAVTRCAEIYPTQEKQTSRAPKVLNPKVEVAFNMRNLFFIQLVQPTTFLNV